MSRFDVIAELAAHQQNLAPDPVPAHTQLIALPLPWVVTQLAPEWGAQLRSAQLAALADELGGGDGPLAITDLAASATGGGLSSRLAALWNDGVRALVVYGARDQPGFARALRYRWQGALRMLAGSVAADLLDPSEAIWQLAPGLVRVAPGVPPPITGERVLAALDDTGDPRRVRDRGIDVHPYAIDRRRSLGAWSGALPPRARFGSPGGDALRAKWDAYWSQRGAGEAVRNAALGLDPALDEALRDGELKTDRAHRARVVAIAGLDGSGKSSHAGRLARTLRERGTRVSVLKLYRQGAFLDLANQLGARTRRGAPLSAFRVSRVIKLVDSLRVLRDHLMPALTACDAVVMDRYLETHVAAADSQLGWDLTGHPVLAAFPPADLTCWLELDPEVSLARRDARGEAASADEHAVGLRGYAAVFRKLAGGAGNVVLDATAPEDANAHAIADAAAQVVRGSGREVDRSTFAPPTAPPKLRRPRTRCAIHLGIDRHRPAFGSDALNLRGELERWIGGAAAGVPEAFWLEAYAAQLVIDVVTSDVPRAAIALWPSAIAAMANHGELDMLIELERMLAQIVEIDSYDPRPESYKQAFVGMGAASPVARRLSRDYAAQLERIAGEHGWVRTTID